MSRSTDADRGAQAINHEDSDKLWISYMFLGPLEKQLCLRFDSGIEDYRHHIGINARCHIYVGLTSQVRKCTAFHVPFFPTNRINTRSQAASGDPVRNASFSGDRILAWPKSHILSDSRSSICARGNCGGPNTLIGGVLSTFDQ